MVTMYEFIKDMSMEEMQRFIYWVYMNGINDGKENFCDTYGNSYFGGAMLTKDAKEVMWDVLAYYYPTQI